MLHVAVSGVLTELHHAVFTALLMESSLSLDTSWYVFVHMMFSCFAKTHAVIIISCEGGQHSKAISPKHCPWRKVTAAAQQMVY